MIKAKNIEKFEEVLKSLGELGVLTCYRISAFTMLLNRQSRNFKYKSSYKLKGYLDTFDFQTNNEKVLFSIDEWGSLLECKLNKEDKEKIKDDFIDLRKYLVNSIFRTIACKILSYKDLNLDMKDFFNGVITPTFLEAYNFYDLDYESILKDMRKEKISQKRLFGKKELDVDVVNSKDSITISCGKSKVVIPKIKINIKDYTRDYKSRGIILNLISKYWIVPHKRDLPPFLLLDPFNLGQPMQFFSEHIIKEGLAHDEFRRIWENNPLILESKISIPPTIVEGEDDVLISIAAKLCTALFKNFSEVYSKKWKK